MKFSHDTKPIKDGWYWCELYGAVLPVFVDGNEIAVWSPIGTKITSGIISDMRFGDRIEIPSVDPAATKEGE